MHQLYPIISLCGLTEACVLIMSGWALFLPCFVYICAWCQLRSVVPSPNSMAESTAVGTEQRSYQLQFMLPSVTLPQMSMRFRSAASRVPATFCNPLHFLALCWPYKYGLNLAKVENTQVSFSSSFAPLLKCFFLKKNHTANVCNNLDFANTNINLLQM